MPDLILCFADERFLYFVPRSPDCLAIEGGHRIPYEHNATPPDGPDVVKAAWEGRFDLPNAGYLNSPWSTDRINAGGVAWLRPDPFSDHTVHVWAGMTLPVVIEAIERAGGQVYLPKELR